MILAKRIMKNSEYSKLLVSKGSQVPCDVDADFEMKLPEWVDHKKLKRAEFFVFLNLDAHVRAILLGLLQAVSVQTIYQILDFTNQSATPTAAYRRYRATSLHGRLWQNELKPGSKAWKSFEFVRKLHLMISRRAEKAGLGIISQKDMAITQFAFVGLQILCPEKVGIQASREQLEDFSHAWRVRGAMLGIEDQFNICGETLDETLGRLEAVRQDFILPTLTNLDTKIEDFLRIAVEGMKGFEPHLDVDTQMFTIKRLIGVPTYGYFQSEPNASNVNRAYDKLSLYSRLRVTTDVIFYEYLSKFFIFRMSANIFRLCFSVFDYFPIFAIAKFGRKYAYVEVLKSHKK